MNKSAILLFVLFATFICVFIAPQSIKEHNPVMVVSSGILLFALVLDPRRETA